MRTFEQWLETARGSVRTTESKHKEIAALCLHDEASGGRIGTWHASTCVHMNVNCCCVPCSENGSY